MSRRRWFICIAIMIAVSATLGRSVTHDFSWWDDPLTLHHNPHFNPPSVRGVLYYWQHPNMDLYVPMTYTVWGALAKVAYLEQPDAPGPLGIHLNPAIFHAASVLVHILTTLIVFAILARLIGSDWAALAGALLFGLHPVQVEAVGWTSGMKDLLCGMFAMLAVWQYVVFRRTTGLPLAADKSEVFGSRHYAMAFAASVLAILSKPTAMTILLMLGVLDFCVFRRSVREMARALWPWFVLTAGWAVVTKLIQPAKEAQLAPLWNRPIVAGDAVAFYLYKLIWPLRLCLDYGRRPDVVLESHWIYLTAAVPVVIAIALFYLGRRVKWLVVGGLLFLAGLAPVLGLVRFDFQAVSTVTDHYLYIPMFGAAVALAWVVGMLPGSSHMTCRGGFSRRRAASTAAKAAPTRTVFGSNAIGLGILPRIGGAAVFAWLAILGGIAFVQMGYWQDTEFIWRRVLSINAKSFLANNELGAFLAMRGQTDEAARHWRRAIELKPDYFTPHDSLGNYLLAHKQYDYAISELREAIRLNEISQRDNVTNTYSDLGEGLLAIGKNEEAAAAFRQALGREPGHQRALRGWLIAEKRVGDAIRAATQPTTQKGPSKGGAVGTN